MKYWLIIFTILIVAPLGAEETSFIYEDQGRRDPFWPLVDQHGVILNFEMELLITDLLLEGIMADAQGDDLAIINGHIVGPQDSVGQFVVLSIKKDSVILMQGQQKFELKLKKEE